MKTKHIIIILTIAAAAAGAAFLKVVPAADGTKITLLHKIMGK